MSTQSLNIPTAQLYIGLHTETLKQACAYVQSIFCKTHGCGSCLTCIQIYEKRHASCLWLTTKKQYVLDDLVPLQEKLQFKLSDREQFFFIIESAELLSTLSANALLKSLEEPPIGYYFILCAKESVGLLPTIISRCVIFQVPGTSSSIQFSVLYEHFTHKPLLPSLFLRELELNKITEEQSQELLGHIIKFWQTKYTDFLLSGQKNTELEYYINKKLTYLYQASKWLPVSGNAKLFWKRLLLQFDPFIEKLSS